MLRPLILLLMLLVLANANAQTHNTNCMRCKFSKYNLGKNRGPVKGRALNECGCEACAVKAQKEHAARQAEEKKRVEAAIAKEKALAEAKRKEWEENQKRQREEAERKKAQEEKDRLARQAVIDKYRELADQGKVNIKAGSNTAPETIDLKVKAFVDTRKKIYGFKIDTLVVFEKPYTTDYCWFNRMGKSAYFYLQFGSGDFKKTRSFILDAYGQEIAINGAKEFSLILCPGNQIHVFLDKAEPEFVRNWADVDFRSNMYADKSSAITEITRPRSGYSFGCEDNFVVACTQYVLNSSLETEQTVEGFRIFSVSAQCANR